MILINLSPILGKYFSGKRDNFFNEKKMLVHTLPGKTEEGWKGKVIKRN